MRYLKGFIIHIGSILFIFILAAFPYAFFQAGESVSFKPFMFFSVIKQFLIGLISGDSFYYVQGDRTRFILSDMGSYFFGSFFYLSVAGLVVLILAFVLGIWLWRGSERFLNKVISFLGIFPDFVLILLMQLFVTFMYQLIGIKTVKVASFSSNDPAVLLPLLSLIIIPLFYVIKTLNEETKDVLTQDYILTGIAKGLDRKQIYLYHVTTNVTPFFKADLHKILSIMISNLFIVEYLFNIRGMTAMMFLTQITFGYQYNLVIFCLFGLFLLYMIMFLLFTGVIRLVERIIEHV
ncbi:ABC transporter permease subunit [Niallia nealsonii]|uniref:Peptide ABC transporter permease n=1 Tax=Niallia nealsonii TaxID=115979 RepID=A0A2N0YXH2_9BACI|nr:ABC transporter permease subunit [Niallia nealsonii]PKG21964.1 peptide ABC transporter permease [Niallia nealsonii]